LVFVGFIKPESATPENHKKLEAILRYEKRVKLLAFMALKRTPPYECHESETPGADLVSGRICSAPAQR
jgi:hypothetical protein